MSIARGTKKETAQIEALPAASLASSTPCNSPSGRGHQGLVVKPQMADQNPDDGGTLTFYYDDTSLTLTDVSYMTSLTEAQYESEYVSSMVIYAQVWGGCCDLCWAVHDNLDGWRRNGIGNIDFHRFDRYCCLGSCHYLY